MDDPKDDRPTWKELAEFTMQQATEDRNVIDAWFNRATKVIGIVFAAAAVVFAWIGWHTISDAKQAATDAAKTSVREILQQDRIQQLAKDTAADMFTKGAYAEVVNREVAKQLSKAVDVEISRRLTTSVSSAIRAQVPDLVTGELGKYELLYRHIPSDVAVEFRPRFQVFKGYHAQIWVRGLSDDLAFAKSLINFLERSGLTAEYIVGSSEPIPTKVEAIDTNFGKSLAELMTKVTGTTFVTEMLPGATTSTTGTLPRGDGGMVDIKKFANVYVPHSLAVVSQSVNGK